MPVYEYKCDACGHYLETIQKMSAKPLSRCPQCEGPGLRRLVSAPAFQLRGAGWYETDFKNRPPPPQAADQKPADAAADRTGDAAGADRKPAAPAPGRPGRPPGGQAGARTGAGEGAGEGAGGDAARSSRGGAPDAAKPAASGSQPS